MKAETRSFYELAVQKAVEQLATDLDRALDLQALARSAALSPFHFHRIFRGMLGETPVEMHRRLRLERAARQLLEADAPITVIAFAAGYETHESFSRAFRLHYSCSPSEFRQSRNRGQRGSAEPFRIQLASRAGVHFPFQEAKVLHFELLEGEHSMKVEIKDMPEMRVATVAHTGPYNRIPDAFARLGQLAGAAGLITPHAAMLGIYHDDPETTPASELRSEAALVIAPDATLPEGLGERSLPAGRYACTTHVGPYEELGDAWARFMGRWLPQSGERIGAGVSYEIYRNTPETVPREQLLTELYIPLV